MSLSAKAHALLSRRLLLPLWHAQRRLRPSRRPVASAYAEGLRFRQAAVGWDRERKADWVLRRLRFTLRRAYQEAPYYRELFAASGFDPDSDFSFDEFAQLPVLERDTVREAAPDLVSRAIPVELLKKDATGGSTGVPTEIWVGPEEMGWKESAGEHFQRAIGAPSGTRTALLWGHHLDPTGRDGWRERYHAFEANTRWFDCLRLSPETLERCHREFQDWQPQCIIAYASAAAHLADYLLDRNYRASYGKRCFVTGAEKLFAHHREKIERAFGSPVHERYGGRDVGYVAFQMQPRVSLDYEVDWANVLVEPLTTETESAILVTKLHADGMPLIRYRVGDVGRFLAGSKPGHPVFTLREVIGRDTDRIWLPEGGWITGLQIPHLMKDYPVREFMFTQRVDYSVEIRIVPRNEFTEHSRRQILATVEANLPGLTVTTLLVDEIPRSVAQKWRPVSSEVDRAMRKSA